MKRIALLVLLFLLTMTARCSVYLFEQFDGTFMPNGWSMSGIGADYWYISETNNAGGTPNELYYYCNTIGTWRLVSPSVDLSGLESINVSFKLRYEKWSSDLTIGIATTSDNGLHWHQGWTQTLSATGNAEINEMISTEDIGNQNVKFCIFFTNTNDNYSNVYIDDIAAFVQRDLDMEVSAINVDDVQPNGSFEVGMSLFNTGNETVTSVGGFYEIDGQLVANQTFAVNVPSRAYINLNFDVPADLVPDNYQLTVGIIKVNGVVDDDSSNNSLSKNVSIAVATTQRLPMFEHFTSSSCGTCPQLSAQMETFCNSNPGKYTYVKYQMNWPSPGDPYYTSEGGVRKNYYGVISIPNLFMDAADYSFNPVTQNDFDEHFNTPVAIEIKGSYWMEGSTIHVIADIMPFADIDDVRVYVAVNEKTTYNNATTNGETSFHHVMMKMLPNAQGTTKSFTAGHLETLTFDYDMSNTHVEEMDDLEVAVWIQKHDTKRVYNSNFLFETANHPYAPENLQLTTSGSGFNATWNAPSQSTPTGYNIWLDETLVAENANVTSYSFNADGNEFHCVQVQAVYSDNITSVKAVATTTENLDISENQAVSLEIYPNPASEYIIINCTHEQTASIHIINIMGETVLSEKITSETPKISVNALAEGVYTVVVVGKDGMKQSALLVVTH